MFIIILSIKLAIYSLMSQTLTNDKLVDQRFWERFEKKQTNQSNRMKMGIIRTWEITDV